MQSTASIPLTRGFAAIVDAEDEAAVVAGGPWRSASTATHVTYAVTSVPTEPGRPRTLSLHKFLTGWDFVDHINGDGLDNRRANLRPATHAQNMANRRLNANNKSGFKGVYWNKGSRKWHAQIACDGRKHHLGFYTSVIEAAHAYDDAATRLFGEYARINFPAHNAGRDKETR